MSMDQANERMYSEEENRAIMIGYDQGYRDCRNELSMKIKAVLRFYLYSEKITTPTDLAKQIGDILDGK